MNVFLGGTCNQSTWRDRLIPELTIDYFNPVVENWTPECYERERVARETADFCLFVITPKMEGLFSLAEVVDTSYKRTDRTLYCYLAEDDGECFDQTALAELEAIGHRVEANGALWLHSLQEVAEFFRCAGEVKLPGAERDTWDVFISYGRRHSKAFAIQLREALIKQGYSVWLDKENIAIAVDFQQMIDEGIRHSANFCYIISPHSVHSEYCGKELERALALNKRIIPIYHMDMGDQVNDIPESVMRLNWMLFDNSQPFDKAMGQLHTLIEQDKALVEPHCDLLFKAGQWKKAMKSTDLLLYGEAMTQAASWLEQTGQNSELAVVPLPEHCHYINQSRLFALDGAAEVCILYHPAYKDLQQQLQYRLNAEGMVTCHERIDATQGETLQKQLLSRIRLSVNIVIFLHAELPGSDVWSFIQSVVRQEHKRTFTLLPSLMPSRASDPGMVIRFDEQGDNQKPLSQLAEQLRKDREYFNQRNRFYCRAMQWHHRRTDAQLLDAPMLEAFGDLNTVAADKAPLGIPERLMEFVTASEDWLKQNPSACGSDVYVCADVEDLHFVERLARRLREFDKAVEYHPCSPVDDCLGEARAGAIRDAQTLILLLPRRQNPALASALEMMSSYGKRIVMVQLQRFCGVDYPPEYDAQLSNAMIVDELLEFSLAELLNTLGSDSDYLQSHRFWLQKTLRLAGKISAWMSFCWARKKVCLPAIGWTALWTIKVSLPLLNNRSSSIRASAAYGLGPASKSQTQPKATQALCGAVFVPVCDCTYVGRLRTFSAVGSGASAP